MAFLADDNFLPCTTTTLKIHLFNGTTGTSIGPLLNTDCTVRASNMRPGPVPALVRVTANNAVRIKVRSPANRLSLSLQSDVNVPGSGVCWMFKLGDAAAPVGIRRKDR